MRLLEVGSNHRQDIKKLADSVVRAWEKDDINRFELAWLTQLSSDERLLAKLYKRSVRNMRFMVVMAMSPCWTQLPPMPELTRFY